MQKIKLAHSIVKDLDRNWLPDLQEINLHNIFAPIYKLNHNISVCNTIVAFIIYAYSNDSPWLNLKEDRKDNKLKILKGIRQDTDRHVFSNLLNNDDEEINEVIAKYLEDQANWKFSAVVDLVEYHSRIMRFVRSKTESEKREDVLTKDGQKEELISEYDQSSVAKVNIQKGQLINQALEARTKADSLIDELNKEYVQLNNAVHSDFGFNLTDERKIDPYSWSQFIRHRVLPSKVKT